MLDFLKNMQCWLCQHINLDILILTGRNKDLEIAALKACLVDISITPVSVTNPTVTVWQIRQKAKAALDGLYS